MDATFNAQTAANAARFAKFPETARVYLPGGAPPAVGSTFRNPDMARAYRVLRTQGVRALYDGQLADAVVAEARDPGTAPGVSVLAGPAHARRPAPVPGAHAGAHPLALPRAATSTACRCRRPAGSPSARR